MEDLDKINRDMYFDDRPHYASVFMGGRVMHVYFDLSKGKHGFEVFGDDLNYQSEAKYSSFSQARSAGILEIKALGGYSEPVIKLVRSDTERKLA